MKTLNIDISNTSVASYALDGAYNEVTLAFSGIPESWETKLVYATFIQDDLNPTVQIVDGSVAVPSEILASNTDFYVGLYAMTEGATQVEEPTTPVLVVVSATESSEIDVEQLIKTIMKLGATINSLSDVAISGSYEDLADTPALSAVATSGSYADLTDTPELSAVATSGSYTDLTDTPELSAVAESGDYADLSGTPDIDGKINEVKNELNPALITSVPTTLEVNKEYSFGEVTELALVFPTIAENGDVIYLTFKSGETATTLTIDTTNTTDIEVIPEANCYYDIFAKFNGSVWLVNYSEYLVSEV